jgi:hemerythrin-like domain-containing protein
MEADMKATEDLMAEHRGIERMLAVADAAATRLSNDKTVPPPMFLDIVDFLRNFADKCHHGKEETELFPAMERAGIPRQGGPIGVMLMEHDQGRAFIRQMAAAAELLANGDGTAAEALAEAIRGYTTLLRGHIKKEDSILFPMADAAIPAHEQPRLAQAFDEIESKVMGPGVHERYHAMLDAMEAEAKGW